MSIMDGKLVQAKALPGSYVRTWGVIDTVRGTYEVRATCRRCGEYASFPTPQAAMSFKDKHIGPGNRCPFAKDVIY